jgi:hypothetical protein
MIGITTQVLHKLTTKPIWYWERNRPYLSSLKLHRLPSLRGAGSSGSPVVNVLCTPNTFVEAIFSAWSWGNNLRNLFKLRIIVDGSPSPKLIHVAKSIIDGIEVCNAQDLIGTALNSYKALLAFGRQHPLGRKLLLSLSLQEHNELIYSDNDVLLFNFPANIVAAAQSKTPVYNQEACGAAYDQELITFAKRFGVSPAPSFNGGLHYIPRQVLDIPFADELLSIKSIDNYTWFDEQTVLALLMNRAGAKPLNPSLYVVSAQRQFFWDQDVGYESIHARHFTGPVRHLMYSKGYPLLLNAGKAK